MVVDKVVDTRRVLLVLERLLREAAVHEVRDLIDPLLAAEASLSFLDQIVVVSLNRLPPLSDRCCPHWYIVGDDAIRVVTCIPDYESFHGCHVQHQTRNEKEPLDRVCIVRNEHEQVLEA